MKLSHMRTIALAGAIAATASTLAILPAAAESAAIPAAKIAAYNTFLLPTALYPNWGQYHRAGAIAADNVVSGQDVVILQELFENAAGDALLQGLKSEYPHQTPVLGRSRNGWDSTQGSYSSSVPEDGGVAVVSKWPISTLVQFVYADGCGADWYSNKGFVHVRLDSPAGYVNVIGTHMQADDTGCTISESGVRARQLAQMKAYIAANIPANEALYVGGDLNVIAGSAEYETLKTTLNTVPTSLSGGESWNTDTNSLIQSERDKFAPQQLDYVFPIRGFNVPGAWNIRTKQTHSPEWTVRSWGTSYTYTDYSDHYPVFGSVS